VATRSILDIEVNDAQFKKYVENYDKYQKALGAQSALWTKAGAEQSKVAANFQKMAAQALAVNKATQNDGEAGRKLVNNNRENDRLWTSMARTTKSVSSNIKDATTSLLRWTGLLGAVGGLLGAGGLFGIDRMAASVSSQRTSARSRGVSIGEQSAFKNFERYGVDSSFLDTVNDIKSDPSKSWSLGTLGVDNNGSTEETAVSLLKAMRQRAKTTPNSQLGLLDRQTGLSMGAGFWKSIGSGTDEEFNKTLAANQADIKRMGVGDKTAEAWQDFTRQMQRAGQQIENVFVNGLVNLSGPLSNLSSAFVGLVGTVMNSKGLKDGIGQLANWIDEFADEIKTGKFQESVRTFVDGIGELADSIKKWTNHPGQAISDQFTGAAKTAIDAVRFRGTKYEGMDPLMFGGGGPAVTQGVDWSEWTDPIKRLFAPKSQDAQLGLPDGTIAKLIGMPDLGLPGYQDRANSVFNELNNNEIAAARNDSPNKRADALQQYGSAHGITITINNAPGNDISVTTNQVVAH